MSNALDHVRYECGIAGEEVAGLVDALERQLAEVHAKLAASQVREAKLREALENVAKVATEYSGSYPTQILTIASEVLALSERDANALLTEELADLQRDKFGLETKLQVKGYQRQLDDLRETLRDVLQTIAEAESMEDLRYCQEYCNQLPITSKLGAGKTEES